VEERSQPDFAGADATGDRIARTTATTNPENCGGESGASPAYAAQTAGREQEYTEAKIRI